MALQSVRLRVRCQAGARVAEDADQPKVLVKFIDLIIPPVKTEDEYKSRQLMYWAVALVGFGASFALLVPQSTFHIAMALYITTELVMMIASFCHGRRVKRAIRDEAKSREEGRDTNATAGKGTDGNGAPREVDHAPLKLDPRATQDGPGLFPMPVQYDHRLMSLTSGIGIVGLVGWFLFMKFGGAL